MQFRTGGCGAEHARRRPASGTVRHRGDAGHEAAPAVGSDDLGADRGELPRRPRRQALPARGEERLVLTQPARSAAGEDDAHGFGRRRRACYHPRSTSITVTQTKEKRS